LLNNAKDSVEKDKYYEKLTAKKMKALFTAMCKNNCPIFGLTKSNGKIITSDLSAENPRT
jgi:acetyl-CoA carboxylase carboxyltransferase component